MLESTYGDRTRQRLSEDQRRALLGRELKDALNAGGNVIVPAFAVERTQEISMISPGSGANGTWRRYPCSWIHLWLAA